MEKYIKVENTIYGLQNIKKVEIKGARKNKKTSKESGKFQKILKNRRSLYYASLTSFS